LLEHRRPLVVLAVSTTVAACTTSPIQRVRSTYEHSEAGPNTVSTQSNLIELGVEDHVGPDLEYRITDKYVQANQKVDTSTVSSDDQTTLHRPTLDLTVTSGPLRWTQLFQSQTDRTLSGSGPNNTLVRNDLLEKVEIAPIDLPQLTAWIN
jgi:hypothetical protein